MSTEANIYSMTTETKFKYVIETLAVIVVGLGVLLFLSVQKESHLAATQAALMDSQSMEMDMSSLGSAQQMAGMTMQMYNVTAGQPVPTVQFQMIPDKLSGYEIHVTTTNFTFTPEKIDQAAAPNEGHVHLYVDGALIVVLGPWYHLNKLPSGTHTIRVALANNDHSLYAVNGQMIQQQQTLQVP